MTLHSQLSAVLIQPMKEGWSLASPVSVCRPWLTVTTCFGMRGRGMVTQKLVRLLEAVQSRGIVGCFGSVSAHHSFIVQR